MPLRQLVAVIAAFVALVAAIETATAQTADFRSRADAVLQEAYPADGPGAAVIVTRRGRAIYAAGRGLADVHARRPITPGTIFRLGSITKQFTAAVILQLVAEGRIGLDDPLSRFFPDYPEPGARATVRQLLNHTSGIQSYTGIPGWMVEANTNRLYTTDQLVAVFRDRPASFQPGARWDYDNSGYVLLGAIIENVTGKPWYQAVTERITRPLGLRSIQYGVAGEAASGMARGYTTGPTGVIPAQRIHMSVPHGAGALIGTVGDLAKWAQALHHGRVVPPALYRQMIAPTRLASGEIVPYGFGIAPDDIRGRPAIGHNGGIFGFSTDSIYIPSEDIFVAVFANSDEPATSPGIVLRRLAALALNDPYPVFTARGVPVDSLEPIYGVYRVDGGAERRFYARDGKLYTRRSDGAEMEVFAAGEDRFFYGTGSFTWFRIARQAGGAHVMEMHQNGAEAAERAVRTGPVPPEAPAFAVDPALLRSYVGTYETGGPVVTITMTDTGVLTIQLTGQPALQLRATGPTEFEVERVAARISFRSENGQVAGLTIHQGGRDIEARRTAR